MGIEDAFLQDILAHPEDDAPRLIYADWLEEQGNPRSEFIRVQCALAQLGDEDPRRWPLEAREHELLASHGTKWLPPAAPVRACQFRRGFVGSIELTPEEFLESGERIFAQAPIRHLCLRRRDPLLPRHPEQENSVARVAASALLSRLRELSLTLSPDRPEMQALVESPYLRQLTGLRLSGTWPADLLLGWMSATFRPNLRSLDLSGCEVFPGASRALARSRGLRTLNLAQTSLTLADLRIVLHSSSLLGLTELNLNANRLTHEAVAILGEGRLLPRLEVLHLDANSLGDPGALMMRDWPVLPRLVRLTMRHNHVFAAGIRAVAGAVALSELRSLDLAGNIACDAGAKALASSPNCRNLRALSLRFNGVGDEGVRALAQSKSLYELTLLNLIANRLTSDGARALIDSPYLRRLARIDLLRNDIGPTEQEALRDRFGPFVYC
jgi:uncharacterized protein (TIGR02996 family)